MSGAGDTPLANVYCHNCQESIPGLRVLCAVCPDLELCISCFSCGAEIGPHKRDHAYRLADRGSFSIFQQTGSRPWQASKELELVEAVEHFGFGNWEDVAKQTNASASSVEEHYGAYYIDGNLGSATLPEEPDPQFQTKDHSCPEGGPLSPSLVVQFPSIVIPQDEQQLLGYMPLRDDFEREYDNDAEHLVSGLEVHHEDDEVDAALKNSYVDMYRMRLRERIRRKRVARDFRLIENAVNTIQRKDQKKAADICKKRSTKDEKDWFDHMKVFAQIQSLNDQESLYGNLQKEKKLKSRLKELAHSRKNGITKLEEVSQAKREKTKAKDGKETTQKKSNWASSRSTGSTRFSTGKTTRNGGSGGEGASAVALSSAETSSNCDTSDGELTDEGEACMDIDVPSATPASASTTASSLSNPPSSSSSSSSSSSFSGGGGGSAKNGGGKNIGGGKNVGTNSGGGGGAASGGKNVSHAVGKSSSGSGGKHASSSTSQPSSSASASSTTSSLSSSKNADYAKLPGYDLLSHKERQLCCSISMPPANYILIKAAILKDHCSRQNGVTVKNSKYHGVEKSNKKKIIEFLATSGWITVP